jgi:RND family efflux transporter MFP subunit
MAPRGAGLAVPIAELATALLAQQEVRQRAQIIANQVEQLLPSAAIIVYVIEDQESPVWKPSASVGDVSVVEAEFTAGTLGAVAEAKAIQIFEGDGLRREDYSHLDLRRSLASLVYVPLLLGEVLVGAIEIISQEGPVPQALLRAVKEIADLASPAIASALAYEKERNAGLHSISRVTQMYDLEKVFNSTLEMDELLETIVKKFQEVMNVQGINLWMVNGESLELMSRAGFDPTLEIGTVQGVGEGVAGDISDNGEQVLIDDPEDERLQRRNVGHEDEPVFSLLGAPLMEHENLVGVVEAINRFDGQPFDDDDQFLLTNICETASNALHNASLLQAERKVEILQTLVQISTEITSTLNLNRVLQAIVNQTQAIIPFDRAAISLEQRGVLQLKAVSGVTQINRADPAVSALSDMLEWASLSTEEIHIKQQGDEIDDPRHETRAKFAEYFSSSGLRAFHVFPLIDDQGRLGLLSFEASDPDFLTVAHVEVIRVLVGQATVALRNASLYQEVPFINVLQPLLDKKRRFLAMEQHRRRTAVALAVAALLFLIFCPVPMRISGEATIASARTAQVQPEVDGVVKAVFTHEGQYVKRGAVLAQLQDWNYRADVAAAQAKRDEAMESMNRALSANDGTSAGMERVKADYWNAELNRARERLDRTLIRAPFDGVVTTPHIEDSVGRRLIHGDTFANIVGTSRVDVDLSIPEDDAALLRQGDSAAVKLETFPLRTFRGRVSVVSPQAEVESDHRVFVARVDVPNENGAIRPGMQGEGKVSVGWHPAGYVFFRGPAMWVWSKLWSWFGW